MTTVNDPLAFAKLIPGFDFMRQFAQTATGQGASANFSDWIAPTVSIEELDKRIADLKAVQFWLEQNAQALRATTQALDVQKMTLSALQGMNFNLPDLAKAFTVPGSPATTSASASEAASPGVPFGPELASAQAGSPPAQEPAQAHAGKRAKKSASGLPDPLQWWGAITQQFQTIAANALNEAAHAAPPTGRTAKAGPPGRKSAARSAVKSTAKTTTRAVSQSAAKTAVRPVARQAVQKKSSSRGSAA